MAKMSPKMAKMSPKMAKMSINIITTTRLKGRRNESLTEDGFGAQDGPKLAPDGPKRPQGAQRKPQDGPKMAPRGAI